MSLQRWRVKFGALSMILYLSLSLAYFQIGQQKQGRFPVQHEMKSYDPSLFFIMSCWPYLAVVLLNKASTEVEKELLLGS